MSKVVKVEQGALNFQYLENDPICKDNLWQVRAIQDALDPSVDGDDLHEDMCDQFYGLRFC